ncbi:hypothetical protein GEMRC1_013025 [Eukaryota sp. GEM-RC1]
MNFSGISDSLQNLQAKMKTQARTSFSAYVYYLNQVAKCLSCLPLLEKMVSTKLNIRHKTGITNVLVGVDVDSDLDQLPLSTLFGLSSGKSIVDVSDVISSILIVAEEEQNIRVFFDSTSSRWANIQFSFKKRMMKRVQQVSF